MPGPWINELYVSWEDDAKNYIAWFNPQPSRRRKRRERREKNMMMITLWSALCSGTTKFYKDSDFCHRENHYAPGWILRHYKKCAGQNQAQGENLCWLSQAVVCWRAAGRYHTLTTTFKRSPPSILCWDYLVELRRGQSLTAFPCRTSWRLCRLGEMLWCVWTPSALRLSFWWVWGWSFIPSHFDRRYCGKCRLTHCFNKPEDE